MFFAVQRALTYRHIHQEIEEEEMRAEITQMYQHERCGEYEWNAYKEIQTSGFSGVECNGAHRPS